MTASVSSKPSPRCAGLVPDAVVKMAMCSGAVRMKFAVKHVSLKALVFILSTLTHTWPAEHSSGAT